MIYRSSQVVSSSEVRNLRLKAVLDLRVLKRSCKKHAADELAQVKRSDSRIGALRSFTSRSAVSSGSSGSDEEGQNAAQEFTHRKWSPTCTVCPVCTEAFGTLHNVKVPIYHSDLVPWTTKLRVFGRLPNRTKARAVKEICHLRNPEKMVAAAVVDPDVMGPTVLYKLLLDHSKTSIHKALKIFVWEDNYPVLVHCIHGKDRTGLIIMLLLLLCDVSTKLVVADYIQSELQLKAGRDKGNLRELDDFLVTDNVIASKAETMVETITHLEENYGSARGYARAVGLTNDEIARIRTNFMTRAAHTDLFDRFERLSGGAHQPERARGSVSPPEAQGRASKGPTPSSLGSQGRPSVGSVDSGRSSDTRETIERPPSRSVSDSLGAYAAVDGGDELYNDGRVLSDIALEAADEAVQERRQSHTKPTGWLHKFSHHRRSEEPANAGKLDPQGSPARGAHKPEQPIHHLLDS